MSTDRELLEKAARAAGYTLAEWQDPDANALWVTGERFMNFAPLIDDGDALRLESALGMQTQWTMLDEPLYASVAVFRDRPGTPVREFERIFDHGGDRNSARRRAGVRAAAALGEQHDA